MTLNEIRTKYLEFCKKNGHTVIPSSSIVPENDPTTLFTGSGMQPLVPYLLGEKHPMGTRLANSQKCFRAEDIDEVGDNRHTTFFEMLGNWSLGEYFKREQLRMFFSFLVDEVRLDPNKLFVTVFAGDESVGIGRDEESIAIWQELFRERGIEAKVVELDTEERGGELGMQGGRIFAYGAKKNWWSRSGVPAHMPEGEPGGPDSEVFYEFSSIEHNEIFGAHCHPNCDCGRYMEIGNSVFMEFVRTKDGFAKLPQRNVDFGGGLERIAAASEDNPDVFAIDVFKEIIDQIEANTAKRYADDKRSFRIVADHIRAACFMMADGVFPSNTGQGYVLRRLLRRAIRFGDGLGVKSGTFPFLISLLADAYKMAYPILDTEQQTIVEEISREEEKFRTTLEKGLKEFEKMALRGKVSGKDAFVLFSTYGFPKEMTQELAEERNIVIDEGEYEKEFSAHRNLSRTASMGTFKGGLADASEKTTALHTATHLMLAGLRTYLGDHIHQAGSNITAERTRFDFTHPEKVSRDILDKVEGYVNEAISKQCRVFVEEMDKEKAREIGVEGSFWEKYPSRVKVYVVRDDEGTVYSRELCGGPHVETTGSIQGTFRIIKEESSSAGVRRVKAVLK
jgi:alanyl-tRNA synthetase